MPSLKWNPVEITGSFNGFLKKDPSQNDKIIKMIEIYDFSKRGWYFHLWGFDNWTKGFAR